MAHTHSASHKTVWILHMTTLASNLIRAKNGSDRSCIKLPTGHTASIARVGDMYLPNNLALTDVLVVPDFKFNLMSISKLSKDNDCVVLFHPGLCLIQGLTTTEIKGIGKERGRLY